MHTVVVFLMWSCPPWIDGTTRLVRVPFGWFWYGAVSDLQSVSFGKLFLAETWDLLSISSTLIAEGWAFKRGIAAVDYRCSAAIARNVYPHHARTNSAACWKRDRQS